MPFVSLNLFALLLLTGRGNAFIEKVLFDYLCHAIICVHCEFDLATNLRRSRFRSTKYSN